MQEKKTQLYQQVTVALNELIEKGQLNAGDTLVIGCSTSEVLGGVIGKNGSLEAAETIVDAALSVLQPRGIYLAAQCCEHLNRAIVVEKAAADTNKIVSVLPQMHAGGSFATTVYGRLQAPVVVEEIAADAGLDIGGTLIGMHLKKVAVPARLSVNRIGNAILLAATTRPKYIGGCRAKYPE